ncbi:MAG: hypothetical protein KDD45_13210, partial [Bdellovibrionales bacterium]|nr:hypothetical protein [Bdellovibrionales bacterium]
HASMGKKFPLFIIVLASNSLKSGSILAKIPRFLLSLMNQNLGLVKYLHRNTIRDCDECLIVLVF